MTEDAAVTQIIDALRELTLLDEEALERRLACVPNQRVTLLEAIGAFTAKSCGQLNKLYEPTVVPSLRAHYPATEYDIAHRKHEYGADLMVVHRRTREEIPIEVKHSHVDKEKKYKSNWCFTLQTPGWSDKLNNGLVLFQARCGETLVGDYMVNGAFIAFYCAARAVKNVNLGSQRCAKCGHYHRIRHLHAWGMVMARRIEQQTAGKFCREHAYFTPEEIVLIFKQQASQCS